MIKIDPTIIILMGEALLALLVAFVALTVFFMKRRKRDRAAVAQLQERLADNVEVRKEFFENALCGEGGAPDAEQKEIIVGLVEKENRFYSRLVEMYMKRNSAALQSMDKMLHEYTSSYLDVVAVMRERLDKEKSELCNDAKLQLDRVELEGKKLAKEVAALREDNERLSTELEAAYAEIDKAMQEYSRSFRPISDSSSTKDHAVKSAAVGVAGAAAAAQIHDAEAKVEAPLPAEAPEPLINEESLPEMEISAAESEPVIDLAEDQESPIKAEMEQDSMPEMNPEVSSEEAPVLPDMDEELPPDEPLDLDSPDAWDEELLANTDLMADLEEASTPETESQIDETETQTEPEVESMPEAPKAEETEPEEPAFVEDMIAGLGEDQSLEDVVLQAMAEEHAAKAAEAAPAKTPEPMVNEDQFAILDEALADLDHDSEVIDESKGPVIDLGADDDIELPEISSRFDDENVTLDDELIVDADILGEALPEAPQSGSGEQSNIDEDELLAQLAGMDDEIDLSGLGDFPNLDADEKNKEK